jgi:hypothetical protein
MFLYDPLIPAKAGTQVTPASGSQVWHERLMIWVPAFAGMSGMGQAA